MNNNCFSRRFVLRALASGAFFLLLGGCAKNESGSPSGAQNLSTQGEAKLVIISPHSREIQTEFNNAFQKKYPNIKLTWLDQGGSSNALNYVMSRFKSAQKGQGIGADVFFGGGLETFLDLQKHGLLQPLPSTYAIPAQLNGVPLVATDKSWVGATMAGFGLLANKTIMARDGLPMPRRWADLGNAKLRNRIALADPRHSGSAHMTYEIILQSEGWDKGWQTLTAMAANARAFSNSSSSLIDDVSSGEAVIAPAIDFYALSKVETAGGKLAYIEPQGQRVVTPDPIGILRDAANQKAARDFVAFVMSSEGQKLWMLAKGEAGGPQENSLYRMAALPSVYDAVKNGRANPYKGKNDFQYDSEKGALRRRVVDDLMGAVLVDNLSALRAASARGVKTFMPVSEAQAAEYAKKWDDATFRATTIAGWKEAARRHFSS